MPMIFIAGGKSSDFIDGHAVGSQANPFRSKSDSWADVDLLDFIRDVDTGERCGWQEIQSGGPDNQAGFVFRVLAKGSSEDAAPVITKTTDWVRASDRVWFSCDVPTPDELLLHRMVAVPTHPVLLGDGNVWDVPRIRRTISADGYWVAILGQRCELPHRVRRTWDGELSFDPVPKFQPLWQQSLKMAQAQAGEPVSVSWEELLDFCLGVLGLRYRFTDLMARAFPDVLDSEALWRVAKAACGFDLVEAEFQKKRLELESAP